MRECKYIIVVDEGHEFPVIFPKDLIHRSVARGLRPVSAGFMTMGEKDGKLEVQCWGDSESLRLKSRPEDAGVIKRELESRGY